MSIDLLRPSTDRVENWIRQTAYGVNQAITFLNQYRSRTGVSSTYTIEDKDHYIGLGAGAFTVTLAGPLEGRRLIFKDETGDAATFTKTISGTIDGGSSITVTTNYAALHLISDGTQWYII